MAYIASHRLEDAVRRSPLPLAQLAMRARIGDHAERAAAWSEIYDHGRHDLHRGWPLIGAGSDQWTRTRLLRAVGARRTARIDAGRAA